MNRAHLGSILAFTHLLTCYFWLDSRWEYFTDAWPVCWPLVPCGLRLSPQMLFVMGALYAATASASAILFYFRPRPAFWLLAAASFIKVALYMQDYRLSGNYHYMHFWVLGAYFFTRSPSQNIRVLLISFYLAAGLLKLNNEWLSGAALPPFFLKGNWLRAACAYVVILELVFVWKLFSRRAMWFTLGQLYVFHAFSFLIVGYFYPLMVAPLLLLFIIDGPPKMRLSFVVVAFWLAQSVPWFSDGDPAVDGKGRLFALSMFDAGTTCQVQMGQPRIYNLEPRLNCDAQVIWTDARHRCGQGPVKLVLNAKRATDDAYTEVLSVEDVCTDPRRINLFGQFK